MTFSITLTYVALSILILKIKTLTPVISNTHLWADTEDDKCENHLAQDVEALDEHYWPVAWATSSPSHHIKWVMSNHTIFKKRTKRSELFALRQTCFV